MMATQLKIRRGSSPSIAAFTGAVGELTYDTDTKSIAAHDGATPGGFDLTKMIAKSPGSASVGHIANGTGAVATTVKTKLQETVSATEYGANDSGVVLDTAPEANALSIATSIRSIFRSLWMYKFPKRGLKVWKRPFGTRDQATVVSITSAGDNEEPTTQVLAVATDSDVSLYPDRDTVALYVQADALPALIATTNTTFTSTSVSSGDFAPYLSANKIPVGMLIDTHETPKKTGVITGVNASLNKIEVSAWYVVDGSRSTATPANGTKVYVSPVTKSWALNANVSITPDSHATEVVGFELGLLNSKSAGFGYLYDAVNLGALQGGNAFQARNSWVNGFLQMPGSQQGFTSISATVAGFYAAGTTPSAFVAQGIPLAFTAKNCSAGFAHTSDSNEDLSYTNGLGVLHTAKVAQDVYADGDTINTTSVVCRTAAVSSTCIINLPLPGGNNTNRLLYLKNHPLSTVPVFFAGFTEDLSGSIGVLPGASKIAYSDGSFWAVL